MLGQIIEWFYGDLAGLAPDEDHPGFGRVRIRPHPVSGITWARAAHDSPRGRIVVAWRRDGGAFSLGVELPPNTLAEVWVPAGSVEGVREGGIPVERAAGVRLLREEEGRVVLAVESGRYAFTSAWAGPPP
jgi:alpha-L-rhamnosidase